MSGKLTKDQLEVIRKRSEKAKAGPWKLCGNKWGDLVVYSGMNNGGEIAEMEFTTTQLEDADFIANARQDIPALLDHIAALQGKIEIYEAYAQENDYYAILTEMGDEDDNV